MLATAIAGPAVVAACDDPEETLGEGTEAGDCEDGADNDGNGMFDCDDPGCAGAPACGGGDGGDGGDDGGDGGDDGGDDGGAGCVTRDDVIVEGSYDVSSDDSDCVNLIGDPLVCQVAQDECTTTTRCTIMGTPVEFTGELKDRGGDNAHGYAGQATIQGFNVDYDIEFRCNQDPTCGYLDVAVVSVVLPAGGPQCVYRGSLI
ncbi:MAG: hypothetical protein AAF721_41975 [Myxococcota bacterium]